MHLFDGDATSVDVSDTIVYWGGHFDFVDGGAYRRKHAAAFDFNGNMAQNWDPEFDTSEGVFHVEVVPRPDGDLSEETSPGSTAGPQPGIGVFLADTGRNSPDRSRPARHPPDHPPILPETVR